jgi:aminopeptidase
MHDPRIDQLASQLVNYSTKIQPGENVLIDAFDVPESVPLALVRAVRAAGGTPFVNLHNARVTRELLMEASEPQLDIQAEIGLAQMEKMQAYIAVRGSHNITETSDVPEERMALAMKTLRPVQNHRVNQTKWCVLRWPNPSMAQQAQMSTEAFEDFYFDVCLLDYAALVPAMKRLEKLMSDASEVHITGPGTDLKFSLQGLGAIACCGDRNIPDGECFSAPVKDSVEGVLSYNTPTLYQGIAFDNMRLEFEKGKIISAEANNSDAFNKILDSDEGARYIGEFAIGFNPKIKEPMRDILFDEKIAGSFHFTPGQAYEGVADNTNRSQVHWDMVSIQRPDYGGGEIHFDGKLIRKDGQFVLPELEELNY